MAGVKISWGKGDSGVPVHIDAANRGLACNATCLECGGRLVAKKGTTAWHFAHHNSEGCKGESIVHSLAKYFLRTEIKPFAIPLLELSQQEHDMLGGRCEVTERRYGGDYSLRAVEEEVAVSAPLRPDCRAEVADTAETIWIEFFYTNNKNANDVEKIREHKISCLEIDISDLTFNSSPQEIIEAVFSLANRKWLSHAQYDELQGVLAARLEHALRDRNALLVARATDFMRYLSSPPMPLADALTWETVQESCGRSSAAETPQLQCIAPEWKRAGIYWLSQATISGEKQVKCSVLFKMQTGDGSRTLPSVPGGPTTATLLIEADVKAGQPRRGAYTLSWHNIARWREKLQGQARETENARLAVIKEENDRFRRLPSHEKVREALGKIGLQPDPKYPLGKFSPPWQAYPLAWKSLVIEHFMRHQLLPVTISTAEIANAPVLQALLGFGGDEQNIKSRRIKLYLWLKALANNNYLRDEGRQHFRVVRLPRNIGELIEVDEDEEAARTPKKVEVKAQVYCPQCHAKIITKSNAKVSLTCSVCGNGFETHT